MRTIPRIRTLLFETPRNAMVAYCLLRDPRVPPAPKAALLGALGFIVSPLDVPAWIPVIGQLDMLALSVLALRVFLEACPPELVQEQEAAVRRGDSRFHHDSRQFAQEARVRGLELANEGIKRWKVRRAARRDASRAHNGTSAA